MEHTSFKGCFCNHSVTNKTNLTFSSINKEHEKKATGLCFLNYLVRVMLKIPANL